MPDVKPEPELKRLLIGTPLHHGESRLFRKACMEMMLHKLPGWEFTWEEVGDCGIMLARDTIAAHCIRDGYDAMLFLATDIGYTVADVRRIISHYEYADIVGGMYVLKKFPLRFCLNAWDNTNKTDPKTGLLKVHETGTDFMFVTRRALEKIIAGRPELEYDSDMSGIGQRRQAMWNIFAQGLAEVPSTWIQRSIIWLAKRFLSPKQWHVFQMGVVTEGKRRRYITEDFYFCHLARSVGIPTYVDTRILLKHDGRHVYDAVDAIKAHKPNPA